MQTGEMGEATQDFALPGVLPLRSHIKSAPVKSQNRLKQSLTD